MFHSTSNVRQENLKETPQPPPPPPPPPIPPPSTHPPPPQLLPAIHPPTTTTITPRHPPAHHHHHYPRRWGCHIKSWNCEMAYLDIGEWVVLMCWCQRSRVRYLIELLFDMGKLFLWILMIAITFFTFLLSIVFGAIDCVTTYCTSNLPHPNPPPQLSGA